MLALGDNNYEQFCKCGIDFDTRLAALGAQRIFERVDCDVDYEEPFGRWLEGVLCVLEATDKTVPQFLRGPTLIANHSTACLGGVCNSGSAYILKEEPFPCEAADQSQAHGGKLGKGDSAFRDFPRRLRPHLRGRRRAWRGADELPTRGG